MMRRTLFLKEMRELAIWAALTFGVLSLALINVAGWNPMTLQESPTKPIPFINTGLLTALAWIGGLSAMILGFRQTVGETVQGTWLLLLHRRLSRSWIISLKLLAGLVLLLSATWLPLMIYTIWAATPGTHASPFRWAFTLPTWELWLALPTIYLGAFLCGLRDARWIGSRLLPLIAVGLVFLLVYGMSLTRNWFAPNLLSLVTDGLLLMAIFHVTATREFTS